MSGMTGYCHVPFCGGLGVRFPWATRLPQFCLEFEMNKIAIISDIHGDFKATQHALKIIEEERCEKIICLGDVLDEGAENESIIQLLNQKNTICIRGNHEDIEQVKKHHSSRHI
jgi:metallophosphoesterase superfamily enzyme